MPTACPACGESLPEEVTCCPGCGRAAETIDRADGSVGGLSERIAGALAYTMLAAILFLLLRPYRTNRFVRFHSLQCIGFWLAVVVLIATLRIVGVLLFFVPLLGHLLVFLLSLIGALGFAILWVVLVVKALQGEMVELPLVGRYAERQARR